MAILGSNYFKEERLNFYWIDFITIILKPTVATISITITSTVAIITTITIIIVTNFIIEYTKNNE